MPVAPNGTSYNYVAIVDPATGEASQNVAAVDPATGLSINAVSHEALMAQLGPDFGLATDHPGYRASRWYLPPWAQTATGVASDLTNAYAQLLLVKQRATITKLGAKVATLAAAGNIQLAIYANANGQPGALLAKTASISVGATGLVSGDLDAPLTLDPGFYWLLSQSDNTTVVLQANSTTPGTNAFLLGDATSAIPSASAAMTNGYSVAQTFGAWPADHSASTFAAVQSAKVTLLQFYVSALPT